MTTSLLKKLLPHAFWLCLTCIAILSVIPGGAAELNKKEIFSIRADYLLHVLAYAVLAVLFWTAYRGKNTRKGEEARKRMVFVWSGLFVFTVATELIQLLLPWRAFNPMDLAANLIGLLFGLGLGWVVLAKGRQRLRD